MVAITDQLFFIILPFLLAGARAQDICSSPSESFYMNIFNEVLINHPNIVDSLAVAPLIQGMDVSSPSYEFTGMGSGFTIASMSDQIRKMSCEHNEVTFSWRAFIRDSQSDGPLIGLSYSGGLESGLMVYLIYMDAAANEIVIGYRHQGRFHSESIPVRLISGRWRDYSVTLSGNLLTFHFNCKLVLQRLVPLPDYCSNESSILMTVVNSINGAIEFTGATGLYVYLQNLGIHFGPEGIKNQCPDTPEVCPTCGQFITLIEKLVTAQEQLAILQKQISELESNGSQLSSTNCAVNVEGSMQIFKSGEFLVVSPSRVCYCDNGVGICGDLEENLNVTYPTTNCNGSGTTPAPNQNDPPLTSTSALPPTIPTPETILCTFVEFGGITVPVGGVESRRDGSSCEIGQCELTRFGPLSKLTTVSCDTRISNCSSLETLFDRETGMCCGYCDACDFITCGSNSRCVIEVSTKCVCVSGYSMDDNGECRDIDECSAEGDVLHDCDAKSRCNNTVGSYTCDCLAGYSMEIDNNNNIMCVDDDECSAGTHNCTSFSSCVNNEGGFDCFCLEDYSPSSQGLCLPVCDTRCQNGGTCVRPNTCSCPPEYTGAYCEEDVDECLSPSLNTCNVALSVCVNIMGSYFCRCTKGFQEKESQCQDVNECELKIHNCVGSSRCVNTPGSYLCLCGPEDRLRDCTGSCVRRGVMYADGTSFIHNCRSCSCLGGELTCRAVECDCNDMSSIPPGCCHQCTRRDCIIKNGLRIRPGSTWINPADRCERYDCLQNLTAILVNLTHSCPPLSCPPAIQTTPMGKCCPICMLPTCGGALDDKTVSIRNGCETCTCKNSNWTCSDTVVCSPLQCQPHDIVFYSNGCCPVCRQSILGSPQCKS